MQESELQQKLLRTLSLSSALNRSMHVGELLPLIMQSSRELLEAEASSLFLLHEETDQLYCEVALGEKGEVVKQFLRLNVGQGIAGWVARHCKPLLIEDAYKDYRFNAEIDKISGFVTTSLICVPMHNKGRLIGTLEVLNKTDGRVFNEIDLKLLEHVADVCAVALENARLHENLQKRVLEVALLSEIEKHSWQNLDVVQFSNWLLERTLDIVEAKTGSIMIADESHQFLRILASKGIDESIVDEIKVNFGVGVAGYVAENREAVRILNIDDDNRFEKPVHSSRYETGSLISTPLIMGDELFGVLNVSNQKDRLVFSARDMEVLNAIAAKLAFIYQNINLMQKMKDNLEEHDRAQRLMNSIMASNVPAYPGIDMALYYAPYSSIGGDFCRFTFSDPKSFGVMMADVSGHGVPAALLSVLANAILSSFENTLLQNPAAFMKNLNELLIPQFGGNYLTAFYMVVDLEKREMKFANAGHRYPLFFRPGKDKVIELNARGKPLGIFPDITFATGKLKLQKNDTLLLYTDGILETIPETGGKNFEEENLIKKVRNKGNESCRRFLDDLINDIHYITSHGKFDDDVTMLMIEF